MRRSERRIRVALPLMLALLVPAAALGAPSQEPGDDLGRLIAELTGETEMRVRPPAELQAAYGAALDSLIPGMASNDPGEREEAHAALERICVHAGRPGAEGERAALAGAIGERLGPATPRRARLGLLRKLALIAGAESVDLLAELLADEDARIREPARRALEQNPSGKALAALRAELLRGGDPAWQTALINSLAARLDGGSAPLLMRLCGHEDAAIARAAISALGEVAAEGSAASGSASSAGHRDQAIDTLRELWRGDDRERRIPAVDALLRIGEGLLEAREKARAALIYQEIYLSSLPASQRAAALGGYTAAAGVKAYPLLSENLREGGDPEMRLVALGLARDLPGSSATALLVTELERAAPPMKVRLLDVLATRGDLLAQPAALRASRSSHEAIRIAAWKALQELGDASTAILMARSAARTEGPERQAARKSLSRLRGTDVDSRLLAALAGRGAAGDRVSEPPAEPPAPELKAELIRALAARHHRPAVSALLELARDPSPIVRGAACSALATLAAPERLGALVEILIEETDAGARAMAEDAVVSLAARIADPRRRATAPLRRFPETAGEARASLVRVLGRIGGEPALAAIRAALGEEEAVVVDAAVRTLARWPDPRVIDDLLRIAHGSPRAAHRIIALRGSVRLLRTPEARRTRNTLKRLRSAMSLATRAEERKLVLSAVAEVREVAALELAESYLRDEALRDEAAVAVAAIARGIASRESARAIAALDEVAGAGAGDAARAAADDARAFIERFQGYIARWQLSGPYFEDGKEADDLFAMAFAPEGDGEGVEWRPFDAASAEHPWIFDLTTIDRSSHRCVYVRASVWSERRQEAILEIGSDDCVKAWLNGRLVHANRAYRPVRPAEDRVPVTLDEGRNRLLLKIVQGGGGWGFCCGFRNREGGPIAELRFDSE